MQKQATPSGIKVARTRKVTALTVDRAPTRLTDSVSLRAYDRGVPPRSKSTTAPKGRYTARDLSVLEGLEAVRKRPGMYIGSTDSRGLMHCLWEIIDNSVDEALEGHGNLIEITLHDDDSVEVTDHARGIPVDTVAGTGKSGVEVVYTKLHAGGKFGNGSYSAAGGLHGVGASVVNALSERLDVEVTRDGKVYLVQFQRGVPGKFDDAAGVSSSSPFTPAGKSSALQVVGKAKKGESGTRVRYWADRQIFPPAATFLTEELADRARQTAFLIPGLTMRVTNLREDFVGFVNLQEEAAHEDSSSGFDDTDPDALFSDPPSETDDPRVEEFRHDGGVVDFVDHLAPDNPVTDTWRLKGSGTFTETVQQLDKGGRLKPVEVERECKVDVALRWGTGYEPTMKAFVNIIATPKGGTHVQGFEQALVKSVRRAVDTNARRLKVTAKDGKVEKDDVLAGMTAVVTVSFPEPQFEGQTKEVLGTAPVRGVVAKVVEAELDAILTSGRKAHREQSTLLLEKVVSEMRARISARMHKEITRRKNALETSSLPSKLSDCRSDDVGRSELFIVEGQSALGTAKDARNSEFQALLPIRGKILNVHKGSSAQMLANEECASIIQVIGAGSGRTFDLDSARYGKIILMTDADVDGAHIRTLLLTFLFMYMRPLVEEGRVFAAVPPLHRVEVSAHGRRPGEVIYTYSDSELQQVLARLDKQGRHYKSPIQRYKGLGEMDAHQLAETTMDPARRTLRRVTVKDAEDLARAEEVFELLMGKEAPPRKAFILDGANRLSREAIDA